jgi:hypothetical protein
LGTNQEEDEMPFGLREHFAEMSDAGESLDELVSELDLYKDRIPPRQYDELWLFCWALSKRQSSLPVSGMYGEAWSRVDG